ncbi:hypothetical protein ACHHYP_15765 [Achlya hypogyna]|uniref:BZIP domain-containing protein n=1 Tax=Achlya hypogyna TaxID=1202772 RepID=A0A1V9YA71_ACHHY|nr:hypothetical protein ACHHYP_15765 [Achlya hypogyna]
MNKASIEYILDARPPTKKSPAQAEQKALEKRLYNRERQQHLRRIETHERQMLKVQIRELEIELQTLQQRSRSSHPATPAEIENRSLKRRMHEYSSFMADMAAWAQSVVGSISRDAAWVAGMNEDHMLTTSSVPTLAIDANDLPTGHRKRLYNRMRQRLYRRREIEEADMLQAQVQELTNTLETLSKCPGRRGVASLEQSQNRELKCRLGEHRHLATSMLGWVAHTTTQINLDRHWICAQ